MLKKIIIFPVILVALFIAFIYSGLYPMGADSEHTRLTHILLETLRERSIAKASKDIEVPDLENTDLLLMGGPDYNDMCVSCHLKPGLEKTDMSIGLYPKPPSLTANLQDELSADEKTQLARKQFWVIKHGIKASGMPAWGSTHSDERIWAMVAFLQKLPELSEEHYQILTARTGDAGHH